MNSCEGVVVTSINNRIVDINVSDNVCDKSSTICLRLFMMNTTESRVSSSNEEICFNIAHRNLTVYATAEAVCQDTGLITFYMLLGPVISKHHKIKNDATLFLYAVDDAFLPYVVSSYCLSPEFGMLLKQCRFHIVDGPKVCFCVANELFVLSTADVLMKYQTLSNLQLISCWSTEEWLLCSGLNKSSDLKSSTNSFKVFFVDSIQSSLYECIEPLIPDVYSGVVTCMLLISVEVSTNERNVRVIDSSVTYVCTSYSQMVECANGHLVNCLALPFNDGINVFNVDNSMGTMLIVLSQTGSAAIINKDLFQVLWVLSGVETVLLGDFVDSGSTQALFLSSKQTCDSLGDMDMLALMDADMEAISSVKYHFADKFLLTDFAKTHIDCWTSPKVGSSTAISDDNSSVSTMHAAVCALRCRLSAGSAQLSAARLECDSKRSLVMESLERLAKVGHVQQDFITPAFPLITIDEGASTLDKLDGDHSVQLTDNDSVIGKDIWQSVVSSQWIIGLTVQNNSNRAVCEVQLLLVPHNSSHSNDVSFTSKCFSHSFRLLPDSVIRKTPDESDIGSNPSQQQKQTNSEYRNPSDVRVQPAACASLVSKHRLKPVDEILPRHTAHVVASCSLLPGETVLFSDVTYKLILVWREIADSMDARCLSRSCGLVTLTTDKIMKQDLHLPLRPDWPITDVQQLQFKLSLEAVHSVTKTVRLYSMSDQSINVQDRLQSLYSTLASRYQFVEFVDTVGCLICLNESCSLYLGCVEAISVKHFNTIKVRLSVRNDIQLLLLIRVLYDCLPHDFIILPASQKNVGLAASEAIQSLCNEMCPSVSSGNMTLKSVEQMKSSYSKMIKQLMQTDIDVLKMLKLLNL